MGKKRTETEDPVLDFIEKINNQMKRGKMKMIISSEDFPTNKAKMTELIRTVTRGGDGPQNVQPSNEPLKINLMENSQVVSSLSLDKNGNFVVSGQSGDKSVSTQGGGGDIIVPKEITELLELLDTEEKEKLQSLVVEEEGQAKEGVNKENAIKELIEAHKKIMESFPDDWEQNLDGLRPKLLRVVQNTGPFTVGPSSPKEHPEIWKEAYEKLKSKQGKSKQGKSKQDKKNSEETIQGGGSKPKKKKRNTKKRKKSKKRKSSKRSKNILQSLPERISSFLTSTSYAKSTKKKKSKRTKRKTKQR